MNYFVVLTIVSLFTASVNQGALASTEEDRLTELNHEIKTFSDRGKSAPKHLWAQALESRALIYRSQKKYSEALKDLDSAIKMHPSIGPYRTQASIYRLQGDYGRAVSASRNAMDLDVRTVNKPALSIDARELAAAYWAQKKSDKAIAILNEALQVIPRDVPLLTTRAEYYEKEHKYKEAIADLGVYQTFNSRARQNYVKRASLHEKLGMYNDAIADYTVLIEKEPDRPSNYYDRAKLLEKIGKGKRAEIDRAEALKLEKRLVGID